MLVLGRARHELGGRGRKRLGSPVESLVLVSCLWANR